MPIARRPDRTDKTRAVDQIGRKATAQCLWWISRNSKEVANSWKCAQQMKKLLISWVAFICWKKALLLKQRVHFKEAAPGFRQAET